ncbi:MAG: nucleotide exchange factor GrpE [Lachnospiraceae bacterium]|nr:nucleotide exchange factor GrpE [Lachnospiraceae bacterium]
MEEEKVIRDPQEEEIIEIKAEDAGEAVTEEAAAAEAGAEAAKETEAGDAPEEAEASGESSEPETAAKPDPKDEKIKELTNALIYRLAEFENFRNRSEKEKSQMFEVGASSVIEKILPVIDNFERGFAVLSEEARMEPFAQGMDKIYKQLMTVMEELDVKPIEAVGQPFDPNLHNAVMHVEDEEAGENVIVEEFQKGYTYRGNVIRYSMVKVAN